MGWRAVCFLMEEFRLNADGKSKNNVVTGGGVLNGGDLASLTHEALDRLLIYELGLWS